jgi:hypothetical protein
LIPPDIGNSSGGAPEPPDNTAIIPSLLENLRLNIQDDINHRFEALSMQNHTN